MTVADIQLHNPDSFVEGIPHAYFEYLRREKPVSWHPIGDNDGHWALVTYDEVVAASMDATTFSSAKGTNIVDAMGGAELMMLNMDPPRHTQLRKLVSQGFTPKMVRAMEPHVRESARNIIDAVAAKGSCDFVTDIAAELPLQVIADLIGIPQEDRHKVFQWSNQMIGLDDPEYGQQDMQVGMAAATAMFAYANELAAARKDDRRDDLVSVLMDAELDGVKLTELEWNFFFLLLAVAGNETTRNLISGGMLALTEHPEQRARLIAEPDLMPSAVEEMLRWVTPVIYFRRTVTRDVEMRGQQIRAGDKITMWYCSANRDDAVFGDGETFRIDRSPNAHVAFGGGGPHFCLGASLARLEIRVMFEELMARLPDIELAGPVERMRSGFINGIKHMPVTYTAR